MMLEHATYPRRREETLPEPRVIYLRREIPQGLRRSGERPLRLTGLPAPLVQLADTASDLPQFARQPHLLGEGFGFSQPIQCSCGLAFPLVKDRQRAQAGHPVPFVHLGVVGETAHLFSGESLVSSPK